MFLAVERILETVSSLDQTRPELVRSVEASLARLSSVSEQPPCLPPGDCGPPCVSSLLTSLSSSVASSLSCRLPAPVATHLAQLTVSLVRLQTESALTELEWRRRLTELTRALPCLLLLLYNRPVQSSHLAEGVTLQAPLSLPSSTVPASCPATSITLIVLSHSSRRTEDSGVIVQLCGERSAHIREFQQDRTARDTVARLREAGVELVISSLGLSPALRHGLRQADIAAVEHCGLEETRHLCSVLGLLPWQPRDSVRPPNLYTCQRLEPVELGGRIMLRLSHAETHHLVLSAVTRQLAEEYSRAVQDSLRSATLLVTEVSSHHHTSSPPVITELSKPWSRDRDCPLLDILHSSMFSLPNLSYDCQTLFKEISVCVLQTLLQLLRIEKICFTAKNIRNLNRAGTRRRIGQYDDSSSESEEEENDDDD